MSHVKITIKQKKKRKTMKKTMRGKKEKVSPQAPRCQLNSMYIASASIFFPDEFHHKLSYHHKK